MGNKLGRKRQVVGERYTQLQGLYVHKDVDHNKLRNLIIESKLAPGYPGDEDCCYENEEWPICLLFYLSLNRSRCCMKGICTECYLQVKNPNSPRPTQHEYLTISCPFCKTSNYVVECHGVKTKEEKGLEQILRLTFDLYLNSYENFKIIQEEHRVIEAKIIARQQELMSDEERRQKRVESSLSSACVATGDVEHDSTTVVSSSSPSESEEVVSAQDLIRPPPHLVQTGMMNLIWISRTSWSWKPYGFPFKKMKDIEIQFLYFYLSPSVAPMAGSLSSPSRGLACAIAALAKRQQITGETSLHTTGNISGYNILPHGSTIYNSLDNMENYSRAQWSSVTPDCRTTGARDVQEWIGDHESDAAEAGTSYASSDSMEDVGGISPLHPLLPPPPPPLLFRGTFQIRLDPSSLEVLRSR